MTMNGGRGTVDNGQGVIKWRWALTTAFVCACKRQALGGDQWATGSMGCRQWAAYQLFSNGKVLIFLDQSIQTTINPNGTKASLTHPPPAKD
jgi:hypothetical protein